HRLPMAACIELENVRHARLIELAVEKLVLVAEPVVATADVEREERRTVGKGAMQRRDERVRACMRVPRRRAEVERSRPLRVRRMEVAAPRLDHGEPVEMMQRDEHGAVAAG